MQLFQMKLFVFSMLMTNRVLKENTCIMALKRFYQGKETADSFIERYVYELYDKHTKHITVVTSDMSEQHAIFGSGAYRISSREM